MRYALAVLTILVLVTPSAIAQRLDCGTSEAMTARVESLRVWSEAKRRGTVSAMATTSKPQLRDGIFIATADDASAPFNRPVDLEKRSILFRRRDATTFVRENVAYTNDNVFGAYTRTPNEGTVAVPLPFSFPFFDKSYSQVSIGGANAVFFGAPPSTGAEQFNDTELALTRTPMISPLWTTPTVLAGRYPTVYYNQYSDRLAISWIVNNGVFNYDVQATLFANGDIRLTYAKTTSIWAGGIVITSGAEGWRDQLATLGSGNDPAGDVSGTYTTTLSPLLDILSASASRLAGTDIIELRMKVAGARSQLASGDSPVYTIYMGESSLRQYVQLVVGKGGEDTFTIPAWGSTTKSPAARFENDTVILDVSQDVLAGPLNDLSVRFYSQSASGNQFADQLYITAQLDGAYRSARTDFRALTSDDTSGPMVEAFTLPVLSVGAVWSQIRDAYPISDDSVDAVAIYQSFYTDIVLYAGAYSTGGNPGVSGIKTISGLGPDLPRSPALLHMNKIGYGWNATKNNSGSVVMHEFGHRWLFSLNIMDAGAKSRVLNPISSHPAQYVHTPAAFQVLASDDASCMGGAAFSDNGNGTFTAPAFDNFGYSWLDLYLMGLAGKPEVAPFYYIANSSPALGGAYYPPPGQTVSGTRREVLVQQVTDGMGERVPAFPDTQRTFKVLFVVMGSASRPPTEEEIAAVNGYRTLLEERFRLAVGGRAEVSTTYAAGPPPVRRKLLR